DEYIIQSSTNRIFSKSRVARGRRVAARFAGRAVRQSDAVFPRLSRRLDFLDGHRRWFFSAADVAAPYRRRLGTRDPARARSRYTDAAVYGGAVYSDHSRLAFALRVDASRRAGAASCRAVQDAVFEPAVLYRAHDCLFRRVDNARVLFESLVADAGPHRRGALHKEHARVERPGHGRP